MNENELIELDCFESMLVKAFIERKSKEGWKLQDFCKFSGVELPELLEHAAQKGIKPAILILERAIESKLEIKVGN